MVESRRDENREKDPRQPESVVSDRRARRKAKRGEEVVRVSQDELAEAEEIEDEEDYDDEDESDVALGRTAPKGAPTRSRREAEAERAKAASATGENLPLMGRIVAYLRGVAAEVQKVTWPTPEDARQLVMIVLGVTIFFSIVLGLIDLFYGYWFRQGVESTTTFIGIAIPFFLIVGFLGWRFIIQEEEV